MDKRITTKGIILDLLTMESFYSQLLNKGKDYDLLLITLLKENDIDDNDKPLTTIKELSELTKLSYDVCRRQIKEIYMDIIENETDQLKYDFKKGKYYFHLRYHDKRFYFFSETLPIIPKIGEQVHIPYFNEYLGTRNYYVSNIHYEFNDDMQDVHIYLKNGWYNLFWHWRRDKAELTQEISSRDYIFLDD